jgi:hypothetical protein
VSGKTLNHWQFAKAWAIYGLGEIILHFNFDKFTGQHAYSEIISPNGLLEIIDEFLAESDDIVFGGERIDLVKLKLIVTDKIAIAFEAGTNSAIANFQSSQARYGATSSEDVKAKAWELAPEGGIERDWFVEGYCRQWAKLEVDVLRDEIEKDTPQP